MARKSNPSPELSPQQNKKREVKEVATKLRNMGPLAQAEVVNEALTKQARKQVSGFTDFLREQSVIGIGIGLVLGTQLKVVVDSITNGLVLPLTQLILPNQKTLTDQLWTVHVAGHRNVQIHWGSVVYSLFNFVMVAIIIYFIFKLFKLDKLSKKKD